MYVPFGGGGYASLRPRDVAEMPLDEIFWHLNELVERREAEAEAIRRARGQGEPSHDSGAAGDE